MRKLWEYVENVEQNKIIVCEKIKKSVEKFRREYNQIPDEDFPYKFDTDKAEWAVEFIQSMQHVKGEWADRKLYPNPCIYLEPWQVFFVANVFGWVKKSDDYRRFKTVYLQIAKKQGKTAMLAAISNFMLSADLPYEHGAEVYWIATKRDQAKIGYSIARKMQERDPELSKLTKENKQTHTIVYRGENIMRPLGRDSETEDGLNPSCIIVDEYHAHKTNELLQIGTDGTMARRQPLTVIITTAGKNKDAPCYTEEYELAKQVISGAIQKDDYFPLIFELDDVDKEIDNPSMWIKANPNLGVTVPLENLKSQVETAFQTPQKFNDVVTKNFNIWTQSESRWILDDAWLACGGSVVAEELEGRSCYGALDLSSNVDITAYVECFPPLEPEERYKFLYYFFMPEENVYTRERKDKVPYTMWSKQGYLILTPGNSVDYEVVSDLINSNGEKYDIETCAYDPWMSKAILSQINPGLEMLAFPQGYAYMSPAVDEFEKAVIDKSINSGDNPIMRWMIGNTELKSDSNGARRPIKPDRNKSTKRIDGVVASIMSYNLALNAEPQNDVGVLLA